MISTTKPMLPVAMDCTANSGSRWRAISENAQATTLSAIPMMYPTLTVTRTAASRAALGCGGNAFGGAVLENGADAVTQRRRERSEVRQ